MRLPRRLEDLVAGRPLPGRDHRVYRLREAKAVVRLGRRLSDYTLPRGQTKLLAQLDPRGDFRHRSRVPLERWERSFKVLAGSDSGKFAQPPAKLDVCTRQP